MMPGGTSRIRVSIACGIVAYSAAVADLPLALPAPYADALLEALDKIYGATRVINEIRPAATAASGQ